MQSETREPIGSEHEAWAFEHDPDEEHARTTGQQMLADLQSMIEQVATVATPVVRDVAAKAAELAAVAAKAAGPIAHRVADVTETVGVKVAAASEHLAADLRASGAAHTAGHETVTTGPDPGVGETPSDAPAPGSEPVSTEA